MSRLGPALAAGIAFAATAYGCENPPPQEQLVDTSGATTMMVPANAVVDVRAPREINSCDDVGEYTMERMEEILWDIGIGTADSPFTPQRMAEKTRDECEQGEMRADCRQVKAQVREEVDAQMRQMEVRTRGMAFRLARAGETADKECLAGYGLAPEQEEEQ